MIEQLVLHTKTIDEDDYENVSSKILLTQLMQTSYPTFQLCKPEKITGKSDDLNVIQNLAKKRLANYNVGAFPIQILYDYKEKMYHNKPQMAPLSKLNWILTKVLN